MEKELDLTNRFRFPFSSRVSVACRLDGRNTYWVLLLGILLGTLTFPQYCQSASWDISMGQPYEFDMERGGRNNILTGLDPEHYLCLYKGNAGIGVVLEVDPADWSLGTANSYEYDVNGDYMGIAGIDPTHFLCTYCGEGEVACASVLEINPLHWSMVKKTTIVYDNEFGYYNALSPIDDTHFLGVHNMWDVTGRAGIFSVDPSDWSLTYGSEINFEPESGFDFMLSRIDATHHLCVYPSQAEGYTGRAIVLIVDSDDWTVSTGVGPFTFARDCDAYSFVDPIDDTHFLCVYQGPDSDGWAVVLTIDPSDWSVSMETPFEYDDRLGGEPNVIGIDDTHFLCAYKGEDADGFAVTLTVDPDNWSISREQPFEFDPVRADYPYLCRINGAHFLCTWEGPDSDGWATVLEVELPPVGVGNGTFADHGLELANYPNPFNPRTIIAFENPVPRIVSLSVYSLDGRLVANLFRGHLESGKHEVEWLGMDSRENPVSAGTYICRLEAGDRVEMRRMTLIR